MEITVSSRHTEVSEALRATTIEKISRLARYVEGMDHAEVHFSQHRSRRNPDSDVCEVTLEGHGHHVRCKVAAPDGFAALDIAVEKLEHQLHKLKTKMMRRNHTTGRRGTRAGSADANGAVAAPAMLDELDELDDEDDDGAAALPRIVKTKRFTIKPMTPEEAVLQMDLLGHDFFFFTNADTDTAAVVYRRADGDVGLIDEA